MVTGDNKGHAYEKKIAKILKEKKIPMPNDTPAGSGAGTDMIIFHNNKPLPFEMKNNVRDPDYGQCVVRPMKVGNRWDWSDKSKKKKPELIEFYNNLKCVDGTVGVLEDVNKKKHYTEQTQSFR